MENSKTYMSPVILMSREGSSMASSWTEHLCISRLDDTWLLGEYGYNWAASVYDIPEEERYTEEGDFKVPNEWKGHKVIGIADGEYIETEELVERGNEIEFTAQSLGKAIEFATEFGWDGYEGFDNAMKKIQSLVSTGATPP